MSSVPPPFSVPEGPRRKDKTGTVVLVIILVVVGMCVLGAIATTWFGFKMWNTNITPMIGCAMNYESVHESLREYAKEHNGKLPKAATWQEDLRPYVKKAIARMKEDGPPEQMGIEIMNADDDKWGCKTGKEGEMTGMYFNDDVSEMKIDDLESKYATPIIFEAPTAVKNGHRKYEKLDENTSPTFMGERRGWVIVTWDDVDGFNTGSGGRNVRFDVNSNSDEKASDEKAPPSDSEASKN